MGKSTSGVCSKCKEFRRVLQRDHIVPKFKGGTDNPDNIQYLCFDCHLEKTSSDMKGIAMRGTGWKHTTETKRKMSQNNPSKKPEVREKIGRSLKKWNKTNPRTKKPVVAKGRTPSLETREKIRQSKLGKAHSKEWNAAISTGLKRPDAFSIDNLPKPSRSDHE